MIPKPKPPKQKKVKKIPAANRRAILKRQVADIAKEIIAWRDGQQCVFRNMSGGMCGGQLEWNHIIRQSASPILALNLGNAVCGCRNHNFAEKNGDGTTQAWYALTFGGTAWNDLRAAQEFYKGKNYREYELEEMLAYYDQLFQNRLYVDLDLKSLIRAGYYGEIVKAAWVKDGRL